MFSHRDSILTGLLAFAGGFLAGILLAPDSGKRTRSRIAGEARSQVRNLESKLDGLEGKIDDLHRQILDSGAQLGERVADAARQAVNPVPDEGDVIRIEPGDVAQDLRRMPRR